MGKILHASGSGYFPACIQRGSVPAVSSPYLEMPLETAMKFYWRVKTFLVTWRIVFPPIPDNPPPPTDFTEGTFLVEQQYIPQGGDEGFVGAIIPVQKEEDLMCAQQVVFIKSDFGPPVPPYAGGYGIIADSRIFGKPPIGQFSFFTNAQKHIQLNNFQRFFLASFTRMIWSYPTGNYEFRSRKLNSDDHLSGTANILGLSISLWQDTSFYPEYLPSCNVTWTPFEYWSFGGTYATGTGQPL